MDLHLLVRLCLGGILLAAGAAKLTDRAGFVRAVLDFGVLPAPLGRLYGWCLLHGASSSVRFISSCTSLAPRSVVKMVPALFRRPPPVGSRAGAVAE